MASYHLSTSLSDQDILKLKVGDEVLLSGVIYMARDAAHKRFVDLLAEGKELPVDLCDQVVFYGGPH